MGLSASVPATLSSSYISRVATMLSARLMTFGVAISIEELRALTSGDEVL